jgi:hypothetical protein
MTSRTLPLSVVKAKMKESWLLNDSCIVDLGNKKLQLTKEEKCDIIKNHLKKFKPEETKEKISLLMISLECLKKSTPFLNQILFLTKRYA